MCPNNADGVANSVDPDQTLLQEQTDLGTHCLPRPVCPKTKDHYGIILKLEEHDFTVQPSNVSKRCR